MSGRNAMTVRLPDDVVTRMKALKDADESLNDLVIHALESELRRRQSAAALARIKELKEETRRTVGLLPGSVDFIRGLREGEGRYDE